MMTMPVLSTVTTRFGVRLRNIYFAPNTSITADNEDLQIYLQSKTAARDAAPFMTSVIDLGQGELELRQGISKTSLYEINRARKKDDLKICLFAEPSNQQIEEFCLFFNAFAKHKRLSGANAAKLLSLRDARALLIGKSSTDAHVLAMHVYICDDHRARLLYSGSNPLLSSSAQRSLIGRGNKLLHWECIVHFQNRGFKEYDLGGISSLANLESNNAFKRSFGGLDRTEFNCLIGISLKGKFIAFLLRTFLSR